MTAVNRTGSTVDLWIIDGSGWRHLKLEPDEQEKPEGMESKDIKAFMLISVHSNEGSTIIEISDRKVDKIRSFGNCSVKKEKDGTGELIISIERKA